MSDDRREFMLQALRIAALKVKLIENELHAMGISLKHGTIDPEGVVKWLHDEGLMGLLPQGAESASSIATSAPSAKPNGSPSSPA
jgi:hypothetical protein